MTAATVSAVPTTTAAKPMNANLPARNTRATTPP